MSLTGGMVERRVCERGVMAHVMGVEDRWPPMQQWDRERGT